RPPNYQTATVRSGGKAVIAAERRQGPHHPIFPNEPEIDETGASGAGIERSAAPRFPERIRRGCLGDAGYDAGVRFHRPSYGTIRSAQRTEIGQQGVPPKRRVPRLIASQV